MEAKITIPTRTLISQRILAGPARGAIAAELIPMPAHITDSWIPRWHAEHLAATASTLSTELGVYEFANLTVFGAEGLFLTSDGGIEQDQRFLTGDIRNLLQSQGRLNFAPAHRRARIVKERVAVFHSHGSMIYGHFLIDMLPKIALMRRAGHDLRQLKYLLCANPPQWQLPMLKNLFGIDPGQLIFFDPAQEYLIIEQAVTASSSRSEAGLHPALAGIFDEFAATTLSPELLKRPWPQDIFIDRRDNNTHASYDRNITNLENIFDIACRQRPYKLLDPAHFSINEQIALFQKAKTVIGEYGSGLHNVVFSRDLQACLCLGHINMLQSAICALRGVKVGFLSMEILQKDLKVDEARFREFIERALALATTTPPKNVTSAEDSLA